MHTCCLNVAKAHRGRFFKLAYVREALAKIESLEKKHKFTQRGGIYHENKELRLLGRMLKCGGGVRVRVRPEIMKGCLSRIRYEYAYRVASLEPLSACSPDSPEQLRTATGTTLMDYRFAHSDKLASGCESGNSILLCSFAIQSAFYFPRLQFMLAELFNTSFGRGLFLSRTYCSWLNCLTKNKWVFYYFPPFIYDLLVGESTVPWAIFRFRIFSNYFSQKFKKNKNKRLKE